MKLRLISAVLILASSAAHAAVVGVSGPNSSAGVAASIIAAPTNALDDDVTNTAMQAFDEAQGVLLGAGGVETDQGFVGQNKRVDSHMIFLNSQGTTALSHFNVRWTFTGMILGVMSDRGGTLEAASTPLLGAVGTNYDAPYAARGMEGNAGPGGPFPNDGYAINGKFLTVGMAVTEPGDWIRVVTMSNIPVPASLPLLLGAFGAFAALRRRAG